MGRRKLYVIIMICLLMVCIPISSVFASGLVNINATNCEVREVLNSIAAVGEVNMVIDDSVTGKMTIQLNDIPFETALDLVTKAKGLSYQTIGNVIVIGSADKMKKAFSNICIFKIKYAKAKDIVNILDVAMPDVDFKVKAKGNNKLDTNIDAEASRIGIKNKIDYKDENTVDSEYDSNFTRKGLERFRVDEATNSIIFNGAPEEVEQVKKMLTEIDVPYEQVSLEAEVVALNKHASKELGVEWEWSKTTNYPEYDPPKYSVTQDPLGHTVVTETEPGKFTRDKKDMSGTIRYGHSPGGYPYEFYYNSTIKALVANGNAKVLAKPKISTINGKEAVINIGENVPIPKITIANNVTTTSIEYKDCGIILKYTPRVNEDGYITATVHTEVSTPSFVPELKAYKFTKRSADTEVRLKDGETMVIGGLIGKEEAKSMSKVPFLSDLPILGSLFKSETNSNDETEVIIFLTARVVK